MTPNTTLYKEESFTNTTLNTTSVVTNSTPTQNDVPPQEQSQLLVVLTTLFFSLIISVGLFGNILIVATVARWQKMRTPCNLLIANICTADIGVCVFAAPLRIIEIYQGWIFGDVICYILAPLQDVFVVVSVVTQTVIALERHRATVTPMKPKISVKRVKTLVPVIWITCYLAAGVPILIFLTNKLYDTGYYKCLAVFTGDVHRTAYVMYLVVLFIAFPLIIQITVYLGVIRTLSSDNQLPSSSLQNKIFNVRVRQKKRIVKMLLVLMMAFQVCYVPRGVIMLMGQFTPETTSKPVFLYVNLITLAMYYVKHVIHPFILWAMSKDFRSGCLQLRLH